MKQLTLIVLLFLGFQSKGQQRNLVLENNFAVNYPWKNWKLNSSVASRTQWVEASEQSHRQLNFLEINQFGTRAISHKVSFSLGYKFRTVDPVDDLGENEHRTTQQIAWKHFENRARLVSRLRLEQRFKTQFEHRYRYRLSYDLPLSGEKLDVQEFYLLFANEVLLQLADVEPNDWQDRFTMGIGYLISPEIKFQMDVTMRFETIQENINTVPFINTNLIFNLH